MTICQEKSACPHPAESAAKTRYSARAEVRAPEYSRRLIILSFGDWNPIATIRRRAASIYDLKCPLASQNLPEGSLYRSDALAADLAGDVVNALGARRGWRWSGDGTWPRVEFLSDRPNKADQLACDRCRHELALLSSGGQASIARAEARLGLPGDLLGDFWQ